jgi:MFS family permease
LLSESDNVVEKKNRKILRTFAAASFLNDMGSDMIYPIWPLFITSVLGANMTVLGFIDGLGEAFVSLAKAISGYWSDRIRKRKIFIWTGYLMGSASRIGYALSTVWQHVIPFRILDRAGKIRSAPRDAIIADISTKENRGKNFGLLRTMDNLGAVCGIIVCLLLFDLLGYRTLFFIAAVPSLIGVILILFRIKEHRNNDAMINKGLSLKELDRNFKLFLVLSSIFALGTFSYSFLIIYAKEFGFKEGWIPVLYLVFTAVASLFSLPFGRLSDRTSRKFVLILSFIFWVVVCLSIILAHSRLTIITAFVFYGLHKGAMEPVQKTLVAELAPVAYRSSSLGGFQMIIGLCALPASLIAGIMWEKLGIFIPFYFSLGLTIIAGIILLFIKERKDS